jgi:hypothetical protein
VCDQRLTLYPTGRDWLCKTSLYSQLRCPNFIEADGKVGLNCVVSPCCKNIHVVSASKSVTMLVKSFSLFLFESGLAADLQVFPPWHHVAVKILLGKPF